MKPLLPIAFLCLGVISSSAEPKAGRLPGRPEPFSAFRATDRQFDQWLTLMGVPPLKELEKGLRVREAFRFFSTSSWSAGIYTVVKVEGGSRPQDGVESESGYLLIRDDAHFADEGKRFVCERTIRGLSKTEAAGFVKIVNAASLAAQAKSVKKPRPEDAVIDGGCNAFDWLAGGKEGAFVYWPNPAESDSRRDLIPICSSFYDLSK